MLRSASERSELDQELGSIEPFVDREQRHNKKEYRRFVDELYQRRMVTQLIASLAYTLCWPRRALNLYWEILGGERRPSSHLFKAAFLHPRRSRDRMRQSSLKNRSTERRTWWCVHGKVLVRA